MIDWVFNIFCSNKLYYNSACVDASIIQSTTRPLSKERHKGIRKNPSSQIDTDADCTQKRGKKYFGYKGHITDIDSKIIRKCNFTSVGPHDSTETDSLLRGDKKLFLEIVLVVINQISKSLVNRGDF